MANANAVNFTLQVTYSKYILMHPSGVKSCSFEIRADDRIKKKINKLKKKKHESERKMTRVLNEVKTTLL